MIGASYQIHWTSSWVTLWMTSPQTLSLLTWEATCLLGMERERGGSRPSQLGGTCMPQRQGDLCLRLRGNDLCLVFCRQRKWHAFIFRWFLPYVQMSSSSRKDEACWLFGKWWAAELQIQWNVSAEGLIVKEFCRLTGPALSASSSEIYVAGNKLMCLTPNTVTSKKYCCVISMTIMKWTFVNVDSTLPGTHFTHFSSWAPYSMESWFDSWLSYELFVNCWGRTMRCDRLKMATNS